MFQVVFTEGRAFLRLCYTELWEVSKEATARTEPVENAQKEINSPVQWLSHSNGREKRETKRDGERQRERERGPQMHLT